jgi:hypothetical protein
MARKTGGKAALLAMLFAVPLSGVGALAQAAGPGSAAGGPRSKSAEDGCRTWQAITKTGVEVRVCLRQDRPGGPGQGWPDVRKTGEGIAQVHIVTYVVANQQKEKVASCYLGISAAKPGRCGPFTFKRLAHPAYVRTEADTGGDSIAIESPVVQ